MDKNHYLRFKQSELILRDELAIDRTLLSNERALLAYLRSAVALMITGVSIIHFSGEGWFRVVGVACIPGALLTSVVGVLRFRKMDKAISMIRSLTKKELTTVNPSEDK